MTPLPGSDATRDRILAAATAEFAQYGIAGARVDRIAKAARTSKERVYAYFRGKQELYRVVSAHELAAVAAATRLDPADLPGYAGRIHDHFAAHPERYRLMAWGQLELADADGSADDPIQRSVVHKVARLRKAQEAGLLDAAWDPLDILVLVNQIATAWADKPGLGEAANSGGVNEGSAARRAAVVAAVQRLFPTAGGA